MRKLKLDPEVLRVESFTAQKQDTPARGTVRAQSYVTFFGDMTACSEPASQNCLPTDIHLDTCGESCVYDCRPTGNDPACYD